MVVLDGGERNKAIEDFWNHLPIILFVELGIVFNDDITAGFVDQVRVVIEQPVIQTVGSEAREAFKLGLVDWGGFFCHESTIRHFEGLRRV